MNSNKAKKRREPDSLTVISPTKFDPLGLVAPNLTFAQWCDMGGQIGSFVRCAQFVTGDWLVYAEDRGNDKTFWRDVPREQVSSKVYQKASALTGIDVRILQNYAYVARNVPHEIRSNRVSWEHHRRVAPLKDVPAKTRWIQVVENGHKSGDTISARRLASSIVAGRVVTRKEMEARDSDRGIDNVHPHVNRIVGFIANLRLNGWMDNAGEHKLRSLARDLQPVVDIVNELMAAANAQSGLQRR